MPVCTIEIADECNRSVTFHPLQQKLRGRWDAQNVSYKRAHQALTMLPTMIPGIQIVIDTNRKTRGYIDPLGKPENSEIIEKIKAARREQSGICPGHNPWPAVKFEKSTENELKTWLYWMRRLVDSEKAIIIGPSDSLPTMDEIESMPGDIHVGQFNTVSTNPMKKGAEREGGQPVEAGNKSKTGANA